MEVKSIIPSVSFGKMYYLPAISEAEQTPKLVKKLKQMKKVFKENGFDRKRYVDVLLGVKDGHFYGIISSKKQGTPYHPDNLKYIAPTKQSISKFKKWLNTWNYEYSPKGLRQFEEMKERVLKLMMHKN